MPQKFDIHQEITDRIIVELESGSLPWAKPWKPGAAGAMHLPFNVSSGNPYSGVNVLLLWMDADKKGFSHAGWLTFKQCQALGGSVIKGSKGTRICYASKFVPKKERAQAEAEGRDPVQQAFLKSYTVFNVDQCQGLPDEITGRPEAAPESDRIAAAQHILDASGAQIIHGGSEAYYQVELDQIRLPHFEQFDTPEDYYRTAFHELGHWTRHPARLNRDFGRKKFGDEGYAREELVAEITAAFVSASVGIQPTVQHAGYIQNWLQVLKNDKRAVIQAASFATKAAGYIQKRAAIAETRQAA